MSLALSALYLVSNLLFTAVRNRGWLLREHSASFIRAALFAAFAPGFAWSLSPNIPIWVIGALPMIVLPLASDPGKEWSPSALVFLSLIASGFLTGGLTPASIAALIGLAAVTILTVRVARMVRMHLTSLEAANETKSRFLANMSHELRTPLAGMIGLNDLAIAEEINAETKALLTTAKTSGEHLLAILNDILDLSKIEAGKLEIERVAFNLRDAFAQVAEIAGAGARAKGLTIEIELDVNSSWRLGDPVRLRQVLLNLTSNAVKFSAHGSIRLEARARGDRVWFLVRDQGPGIAPEHLENLFQPFVQADASITRTYGGTGLGLSISQRLVRSMGGTIEVSSELGKGSEFRFEVALPVAAESIPRPTPAPRAQEAPQNLRVLVAEDNVVNQLIVKKMLRNLGHRAVVVVGDGEDALIALAHDEFDVILMDVQMPKRDGLETARAIRADISGRARKIPIIALTANAMRGDDELCRDAGMTDYMVKPVTQAALAAALQRAVPLSRAG